MSGAAEPPDGLTRRAALRGAAGVGIALAGGPPAALASAARAAAPPIFSRSVGAIIGTSRALNAPRRFALLGVEWAGPAHSRIELRTRGTDGGWSRWVPAAVLGHGPDRVAAGQARFGEAIWSGDAEQVQLRSDRRVRGVRIHFIAATPSAHDAAAPLPLATPTLPAGPGQPPIIARSAWAAGQARPAAPPSYGTVRLAFVHHTENLNGYLAADVPAMLLAMYQFHRFVRGWGDIAYNFVIDAFGRIWEARSGGIDAQVIATQAGGYNQVSTGVAMLGSFMTAVPPSVAMAALERLLAWKLALHSVPARGRVTVRVNRSDAFYTPFAPGAKVSLPRIAGHRDGDSTDCPGDALYARLPAVRRRVARLEGTPATLTLSAPASRVRAGAPLVLSGRLTLPDALAVAGAEIALQTLRGGAARTVATATAAADGSWTTTIAPSRSTVVRALHAAAPAVVSDPVSLLVRR